jgi:hypothetical protein
MHVQPHERLYLLWGAGICAALGLHGVQQMPTLWATVEMLASSAVLVITLLYAAVLRWTQPGAVARVLAAYAVTWCLYAGSTTFVSWMHLTTHETTLLRLDRLLLGQTPAEMLHGKIGNGYLDLLSLGYMSYHVYLHWALVDLLFRNARWRSALSEKLFLAFGVGFMGYYLYPAAPPKAEWLGITADMPQGCMLTRFNEWLNANMAARYDAFPSLHVLITATLLAWDWRHARWRFRIMLAPSLLMLAATLALRLHYFVDLLASALLFLLLSLFHARRNHHRRLSLGA